MDVEQIISENWELIMEKLGIHTEGTFSVLFPSFIIPISIYGILILAGFLLTFFFVYLEWKYKKHSTFHLLILFGIGAIVGVFAARWWYLAFNPSDFHSFYDLFALQSGRSILGSIVFGTLAIWLYSRKYIPEIEWAEIFSILLPNILIGQALARWGNFYDYNVYGQPIGTPYSLLDYSLFINEFFNKDWIIPDITIYYQKDALSFLPDFIRSGMLIWDDGTKTLAYRQPLFLYESLATFVAWIIITFYMKRINYFKEGTHGGMFLIFYGLIRASMELFRDPLYIMSWGTFPTSFYLALLILLSGIITFIYYQWKEDLKFQYQFFIFNFYIAYKLFQLKL